MCSQKARFVASLVALATALVLVAPASEALAWTSSSNCGPTWDLSSGPNPWHLNQDGYSSLSIETVEDVLIESMDSWSEPCCSSWRASYQGRTSVHPRNKPRADGVHAVGFAEGSWPLLLGNKNRVIAVTMTSFTTPSCEYTSADLLFNAVGFTFTVDPNNVRTDLGSIAMHEFGHWLGLGHSNVTGAMMAATYRSGTVVGPLHQDDIDGVCSLYERSCEDSGCSSNAECGSGMKCDVSTGECVDSGCSSSSDCGGGMECNRSTGECYTPGCGSDSDCFEGQTCQGGACIRSPGGCEICEPCVTDTDCGPGVCVFIDGEGSGFCSRECSGQASCPGDSTCAEFSGGQRFCFNPGAGPKYCPNNWSCDPNSGGGDSSGTDSGGSDNGDVDDFDSGGDTSGASPGGTRPDRGGGSVDDADRGIAPDCPVCMSCTSDDSCGVGGRCIELGSRMVCSSACEANSDCPGDSLCFNMAGDVGRVCLNPGAGTSGACPSDYRCSLASPELDDADLETAFDCEDCAAGGSGRGAPTAIFVVLSLIVLRRRQRVEG